MGKKKEPWARTGCSLPERVLEYLDKIPLDRSAAISLCIEYAAKTDLFKTFAGELDALHTAGMLNECHNCHTPILADQSYGVSGLMRWHLDVRNDCPVWKEPPSTTPGEQPDPFAVLEEDQSEYIPDADIEREQYLGPQGDAANDAYDREISELLHDYDGDYISDYHE